MVGIVTMIGFEVAKFKVGDHVGVDVWSCHVEVVMHVIRKLNNIAPRSHGPTTVCTPMEVPISVDIPTLW